MQHGFQRAYVHTVDIPFNSDFKRTKGRLARSMRTF